MFKSLRTLPLLRPLIPSTTSSHNHIIPPRRPKSTYESTSDAKIPSKGDLNPASQENTPTGTHDEVAHADNTSYNPDLTDPSRERSSAGAKEQKTKKSPGNPLDASPANPGIGVSSEDGRAEVGPGKSREGRRSGGSKDA